MVKCDGLNCEPCECLDCQYQKNDRWYCKTHMNAHEKKENTYV